MDIWLENFLRAEKANEQSVAEANRWFSDLVKQLILVATVLITFTSPIFSNDVIRDFSNLHKILLITSWLLLAASIAAGIGQSIADINFFLKRNAVFRNLLATLVGVRNQPAKVIDTMLNGQKDLPVKCTQIPMVLQIILLGLGFSLQATVMIGIIF